MRDPRHDILFEPVRIGPVTARNRFYQVPHCTGMGWLRPEMLAAMRGVKAEGGWAVVCTEYCSIHPTSDDLPAPYARLWDAEDVRAHARMVEAVHAHGALAGVELWHGGGRSPNLYSREVPIDIESIPCTIGDPYQSRAMDREDIRAFRRWHREAALRAREAGFDIVYVYATHDYLLARFLSPETNTRTDEYGGSLENRVRLVRELIEETKEAVGDRMAVAVRFAADERPGADGVPETGERREMFAMLAELPDLWDINIADYTYEMGASRFAKEGALAPYMGWVREATSKPVVTVGRYTSPDAMAEAVRRGVTDFIGAARPSIADPFLPRKIEEGRVEDIRECIGCNICYAGDGRGVPIRCTQNPTMGEEWRRGWHPERLPRARRRCRVLIVGAGPAGLEAARVAGAQGHEVMLAEARRELGGRITREARLPGLAEWARVRDWRLGQIARMTNVAVYPESLMDAADVLEVGADHVLVATGARWRRDARGRHHRRGVPGLEDSPRVFTPDDIMDGRLPEGRIAIFDDDHYYMGAVIAEQLLEAGREVVFVTPEARVAAWSAFTVEQHRSQARLMERGAELVLSHGLSAFEADVLRLACVYTGHERQVAADALVLITARAPEEGLYHRLRAEIAGEAGAGRPTLARIGDCEAPAIIAAAVYAGYRWARGLEGGADG